MSVEFNPGDCVWFPANCALGFLISKDETGMWKYALRSPNESRTKVMVSIRSTPHIRLVEYVEGGHLTHFKAKI